MLTINIKEKKYANRIILENINIHIAKAGIYGLVGKNGVGKTTLFKCVLELESYIGNSQINNINIALQNVAWCPTEPSIYKELTANEFYDFYSHLLDFKKSNNKPIFNVADDKLIQDFSTGMKKKTYLNAIFQKEYPVYFLDEPFNGLDLESNYILIQYLIEKSKESIIIISSHILDILYNNCEEIFVLNNNYISKFEKENFNQIHNALFAEL
jgi:ABC-2 type transport system ATP-binding protein